MNYYYSSIIFIVVVAVLAGSSCPGILCDQDQGLLDPSSSANQQQQQQQSQDKRQYLLAQPRIGRSPIQTASYLTSGTVSASPADNNAEQFTYLSEAALDTSGAVVARTPLFVPRVGKRNPYTNTDNGIARQNCGLWGCSSGILMSNNKMTEATQPIAVVDLSGLLYELVKSRDKQSGINNVERRSTK